MQKAVRKLLDKPELVSYWLAIGKGPTLAREYAMTSPIEEILGHLGAAKMQTLPEDDQIIAGHVRDAHEIALGLFRQERSHLTKAQRIAGHFLPMTDSERVELIRLIAKPLSCYAHGYDTIENALDWIDQDIAEDDAASQRIVGGY